MMRTKLAGAGIALAAAGILGAAPAQAASADETASAAQPSGNPTGYYYGTFEECEAHARLVRDSTTGAWCVSEGFLWQLYTAGD